MTDTSYEHKIIAAAMRMEAAWTDAVKLGPIDDDNFTEFRTAVEQIVEAVRGMRKRRASDAQELMQEKLRESHIEYDDDLRTSPTEPPPRRDKGKN